MDATKKVTFDTHYVCWFYKTTMEEEGTLSWTQIALDELRFRRKLEALLMKKIDHLLACDKNNHEMCTSYCLRK